MDKARIKAHHDPGESVNRETLWCDQKLESWAEKRARPDAHSRPTVRRGNGVEWGWGQECDYKQVSTEHAMGQVRDGESRTDQCFSSEGWCEWTVKSSQQDWLDVGWGEKWERVIRRVRHWEKYCLQDMDFGMGGDGQSKIKALNHMRVRCQIFNGVLCPGSGWHSLEWFRWNRASALSKAERLRLSPSLWFCSLLITLTVGISLS